MSLLTLPGFSPQFIAAAASATTIIMHPPVAGAATPVQLLSGYTEQAGSPALPARGQQLFTERHGREWSLGPHVRSAAASRNLIRMLIRFVRLIGFAQAVSFSPSTGFFRRNAFSCRVDSACVKNTELLSPSDTAPQ